PLRVDHAILQDFSKSPNDLLAGERVYNRPTAGRVPGRGREPCNLVATELAVSEYRRGGESHCGEGGGSEKSLAGHGEGPFLSGRVSSRPQGETAGFPVGLEIERSHGPNS